MNDIRLSGQGFSKIDSKNTGSIIKSSENKMRIDKKTAISAAVILSTLVVGGYLIVTKRDTLFNKDKTKVNVSTVQLKFTEKNYKLDYSSLPKETVVNIAGFEKNEDWQGDADFDDIYKWEGETSLILTSKNNEKAESYLNKKIDLGKYLLFNIAVYLQTDPSDRESVKLYFANKDKTAYFAYPLTDLNKGWNFIRIPKIKFSSVNAVKDNLISSNKTSSEATIVGSKEARLLTWDKIERIGVEVISRQNSTTTVDFDSLSALESEDFLDDWLVGNPIFLDLVKTNDEKIILQAKNVSSYAALIKKLGGISNFTFKVKMQPIKKNTRSGIFAKGDYKTGYGYYFLIDGLGGNRWQIHKIGLVDGKTATTVLKSGVINNFMVEEKKPLWLKVEAKGDKMKFYLSTDGKSFSKLEEVSDLEFKEGGLGITVYDGGATQFEEMEFSQ